MPSATHITSKFGHRQAGNDKSSYQTCFDYIQSINQSKPVTPRPRWSTLTDASAVMAAHRRLSSVTRSNDDIDWPVLSLMLSVHDLRGLPL